MNHRSVNACSRARVFYFQKKALKALGSMIGKTKGIIMSKTEIKKKKNRKRIKTRMKKSTLKNILTTITIIIKASEVDSAGWH